MARLLFADATSNMAYVILIALILVGMILLAMIVVSLILDGGAQVKAGPYGPDFIDSPASSPEKSLVIHEVLSGCPFCCLVGLIRWRFYSGLSRWRFHY